MQSIPLAEAAFGPLVSRSASSIWSSKKTATMQMADRHIARMILPSMDSTWTGHNGCKIHAHRAPKKRHQAEAIAQEFMTTSVIRSQLDSVSSSPSDTRASAPPLLDKASRIRVNMAANTSRPKPAPMSVKTCDHLKWKFRGSRPSAFGSSPVIAKRMVCVVKKDTASDRISSSASLTRACTMPARRPFRFALAAWAFICARMKRLSWKTTSSMAMVIATGIRVINGFRLKSSVR
mmetsp:Transcript_17711/g.50436  ORF Transcript_17711/g.50436 Transcript_17711/m.50436 type:complete len:235 (+) Transcript_17711:456-1160(+)